MARVAEASASADTVRIQAWAGIEVTVGLETLDLSGERPMMTGHSSGSASYLATDMSAMFEGLEGSSLLEEMTAEERDELEALMESEELLMETVETEDLFFMRWPMMAAIWEITGTGEMDPATEAMMSIAHDWGVLDLSEYPNARGSDLIGTGGSEMTDVSEMLALMMEVEEVEIVGSAEVRGVETTHVRAPMTFEEMLALQDQSIETVVQQFIAEGTPPGESRAQAEAMADVEVVYDVFVGEDDLVRRMGVDMSKIEVPGSGPGSFSFVMDMFDYGASDIVVAVPDPDTSVNLAELFGIPKPPPPTSSLAEAYWECMGVPDAMKVSDNEACDALHQACAGGDLAACDDMWLITPVGSEYERFGASCGDPKAQDDFVQGGTCFASA